MLTPPPPLSKPVSIEWYEVDARIGIRITGTFDVSLTVSGETERPSFETMENEIEAAIVAVLVKHANRTAVN